MAVVHLESLVLRGIHGVGNVVSGLARNGSRAADGRTPTESLSLPRHVAGHPQAVMGPGTWRDCADYTGAALAVPRAGRLGCSAGVPDSRSPASFAGWTILSGWSFSGSGTDSATWYLAAMTRPNQATPGTVLPERCGTFARGLFSAGSLKQPDECQADKRAASAI